MLVHWGSLPGSRHNMQHDAVARTALHIKDRIAKAELLESTQVSTGHPMGSTKDTTVRALWAEAPDLMRDMLKWEISTILVRE